MLGWFYRAVERHLRSKPAKLAARLKYVPPWLVDRVARAKLARTLRHVWDRNPVQRERWRAAGICRADLRSPDALSRIPFFDATLLWERPEDCFCAAPDKMPHLINTAGTTGKHKQIYLTTEDLHHQTRIMGMRLAGLKGASRVLVMLYVGGPTWTAGPMGQRAAEHAGLFSILYDQDRTPAEQLGVIRTYRIDTVVSSMTTVQRLTREAGCDLKALGVKYFLLSLQPWPEAAREEIERAWGATVLDVYGLMEFGGAVAAECPEKRGLHVAASDFWVEVVDPDTGAALPDGEYGEVVLTTLSRRGLPLVRYRTHDHACLMPENGRCACGTPTRRLSRILGRLDQVLILGPGNNFYPHVFDNAVLAVSGVSDYQLTVDRDGFRDVLGLAVESDEPIETLADKLREALLSIRQIRIDVTGRKLVEFGEFRVVPRGTLSAGRPKSVRIVDRRKMSDRPPDDR